MAKKKLQRKKRVQKPQPLPKSVQALLRYLGGSDVKVASSARQPAMVAQQFAQPTQQQQQQQQQPQPQRQRQRRTGQVVAASPLSQLAPAPQLPVELTPEQKKARLEAEAKAKVKAEAKQKGKEEATAKVEQLEKSLSSFKQQAGEVAVALSEGIRKSLKASQHYQGQDYDPLDDEMEFSASSKPYIEEQGLQVSTTVAPVRSQSIPMRASAAYEAPEVEPGQGAYAASQYVKAISSPEMTPKVTARGRPRLTEQQKAANAEAKKLEKEQKKQLLKETAASLYKEGQSATKALEALTTSIKEKKVGTKPRMKVVSIPALASADPSTQVELLASARGGAAAQPAQSRGRSVLEMMTGKSPK